jgi:hypothetical protein
MRTTPPTPTALALGALVAVVLALTGCRRDSPEQAAGAVENPGLGITLASLPSPFQLTANEGETIVLAAPGPGGEGQVIIAAGPPQSAGVNLVEAVKERKAAFEALPGGEYLGNRELVTPMGTAFTARGTYQEGGPAGGAEVEETWVYLVHPAGDRVLTVRYTYPLEAESKQRVDQLLALVGEIGPLGGSPAGDGEAPLAGGPEPAPTT